MGHEQEEGGRWPYAGTAEAIKALGARHCVKDVTISLVGQAGLGDGRTEDRLGCDFSLTHARSSRGQQEQGGDHTRLHV